ncbi:hypothetical protein AVEN_51248-1, partial [Araneus ventricosus]
MGLEVDKLDTDELVEELTEMHCGSRQEVVKESVREGEVAKESVREGEGNSKAAIFWRNKRNAEIMENYS